MESERTEREPERPAAQPSAEPPSPLDAKRLISLDAFRGLAVFGMLLVNNKELGPWTPDELHHASWGRGVHAADMVYPWFLLAVGMAIPFSAASAQRKGLSRHAFTWRIITRSLLLVLIGILLNSSAARQPVFDLGILQLIGFAYLGGAVLYRLRTRWRALAAAFLLVGYWAALRFVPFPGAAPGTLTPRFNLIQYLNEVYLRRISLEYLPVIAPTTALVLIGTFAGDLVRHRQRTPVRQAQLLAAAGVLLAFLGLLWSFDQIMVKPLWTSPYVVFSAGAGLLVFALFYWLTDIVGWAAWSFPLVVFGANAITAFTLPVLVNIDILDTWIVPLPTGGRGTLLQFMLEVTTRRLGPGPGGLLFTVAFLFFWWLVLYGLYRKRIFIRV